MAEVAAPVVLKCRACPRHYDNLADLCQVDGCYLCRGCHHTAYGVTQPHQFNDANLLRPDVAERLKAKK